MDIQSAGSIHQNTDQCLTGNLCLDEKLPVCKAQKTLKPQCAHVYEPTYIIGQSFEETPQVGNFSFKHSLIYCCIPISANCLAILSRSYTISTRRFSARPFAVSFVATGW